MPEWIRDFLQSAKVDSYKSSAMAPLQWLVGICLSGAICLAFAGLIWLPAILVTIVLCLCIFYCYVYLQNMWNNPDALRSERYALHKIAIEKGLVGDDRTGLRDADDIGGARQVADEASPQIEHKGK
jgi:hypothetical protein